MKKASKKIKRMIAKGDFPSEELLEAEIKRQKYKLSFSYALRSTIFTLITASAAAVLVAVLVLPVLQIRGTSMTPTLNAGEYVVSVKGGNLQTGDICAFYEQDRILVKRVIAVAGDWVNIDENGKVWVNDSMLDEPYVSELAKGECDVLFPHQVEEERVFVLGDHRSNAYDSRIKEIGDVPLEKFAGKIVFRVWPLSSFGFIE